MTWFTSDNAGAAAPEVMEAVVAANTGYTKGYGDEALMDRVRDQIREVFEAPEAAVYLVSTGTAANALSLATLVPPWSAIYCHREAHAEVDECGAPEFYTGGAKLVLVGGDEAKMTPAALGAALDAGTDSFVHGVQRGAVTLTNVTERGAVYTAAEVAALNAEAERFHIPVHMDGARFANAIAATNATPAEMTWRAGIDVLSFGGTKNGCMAVEAVVLFNPEMAWEFELRRKRGGHLFSKHRYLSAQMSAYLEDGLWLRLAGQANRACARLRDGLADAEEAEVTSGGAANMLFVRLREAAHARLQEAGIHYYAWPGPDGDAGGIGCRLVTNWATTDDDVDRFLSVVKG